MSSPIIDRTGTFCPRCGETDSIRYFQLPDCRLEYGNTTEVFGPLRDCLCSNCDAEWLMPGVQP